MNQSVFIACLCLCAALWAGAQDRAFHPVQAGNVAYVFGLKAGISSSDMHLKDTLFGDQASFERRAGIHIGMVYHRPLSRNWALQGELVFSSQGYKLRLSNPGSGYEYREEVKQAYLNLPLLVQYVTGGGITLYSGLQPGLLLDSDRDNFKNLDLAWVAGVAYIAKIGLGLDVRYNAGLINIASDRYSYQTLATAKNRVVQAGVVYLFATAKKRGQ